MGVGSDSNNRFILNLRLTPQASRKRQPIDIRQVNVIGRCPGGNNGKYCREAKQGTFDDFGSAANQEFVLFEVPRQSDLLTVGLFHMITVIRDNRA